MVLIPKTEAEHAHNNACSRADQIIRAYAKGEGLFQMTRPATKKDKTEKGEPR
jgi:hypothetical protein